MEPGQRVSYRGSPRVYGDRTIEPGTSGEVISVLRYQENWFGIRWDGMGRTTFHLEEEIEPLEAP